MKLLPNGAAVVAAVVALAAAAASSTADAAAAAFVPQNSRPQRRRSCAPSRLRSRPDSADAVAEAQRISKEFGPTSKEARVAWEIVEEMDASDVTPATSGGIPVVAVDPRADYSSQVRSLSFLLEETSERLSQMKTLASQIRDLELSDPSLSKLGPEAEGLRRALQEAKAAAEVHGPGSDEAASAWGDLEACAEDYGECSVDTPTTYRYSAAALKAHHYYDAVVDPELLSEAIDAFDSIDALSHFMQVEKNRLDKLQS